MNDLEKALEQIIDREGLAQVLEALATICGEKAEHLRCNWQDEPAAKEWDRMAKIIDKASAKATAV